MRAKKNKQVNIALTEAQLELIQTASEESDMTVSEFVRRAAIKAAKSD